MRKTKSRLPDFAKLYGDSPSDRRPTLPVENSEQEAAEEKCNVFTADPVTSRRAARAAVRAAEKISRNSRVIDPAMEDAIPRFRPNELSLGELLGKGGFSDVYEIFSIDLSSEEMGYHKEIPHCTPQIDEDNDVSLNYPKIRRFSCTAKGKQRDEEERAQFEKLQRSFIAEHCVREETGAARYAIKHLSDSCVAHEKQFRTGAADLAVEAKLLSCLEHPNIIKLRGLSETGPEGFATGMNTGYFLILDRLFGTLEEKLEVWSHESQKCSSNFFLKNVLVRKGEKRQEIFASSMKVAFDVASALAYLHSRNIIYRDLKPENIGFDIRGDIKIFDFGLAKELSGECKPDNTYKLSGNTGSLRYMAPEVARNQDYNLSADVYSCAILLWQIFSLEKPYDGMDRRAHSNQVVYGSVRPKVDPSWSEQLRKIIQNGWHSNLHKRPSMDHVYRVVRLEAVRFCGGGDIALNHRRRRSTHVLGKQLAKVGAMAA